MCNVQEKGTTPLHVAARAGQALQVELLVANGANPSVIDTNGQTAADIAKYNIFNVTYMTDILQLKYFFFFFSEWSDI